MSAMQEKRQVVPPQRKKLSGTVTSAGNMQRTITVAIERHPWHARLRKQLRRQTKLLVDDPKHEAQVGDRVLIEETRPLSKRKHFRLLQIVSRRPQTRTESETGREATGYKVPGRATQSAGGGSIGGGTEEVPTREEP